MKKKKHKKAKILKKKKSPRAKPLSKKTSRNIKKKKRITLKNLFQRKKEETKTSSTIKQKSVPSVKVEHYSVKHPHVASKKEFPLEKTGKLSEKKEKDQKMPSQKTIDHLEPISKGKVLEKYPLDVDGAKVDVEIIQAEGKVTYNLRIPEISPATATLLNDIRNDLISLTTISVKEIVDPEAFSKVKERFRVDAEKLLEEKLQNLTPELSKFLIGRLMQEMLGLGEMEFLINDPSLEEIVVPSSKEPIRVYLKKYGWITTNLRISKEEDILNYCDIVARRVGRQITVLSPLLDAPLVSGDRVNAVLYPINTKGNTITIRKFARDPYTIISLIKNKTCDLDTSALLWMAIEYEMNIIISGGTASGKTVLLNACMPFMPPGHRILSIEDTRELMLPEFLYWTPLVTRMPNPEGKGGISMLDLLVNALRMRPDRIILGEMRKEEEARVLFEAMHTGHSVYATLHADSAAETVSRLIHPPLNIPPNLLKAVNLNVVMFRDRRRGIRRITQVAEFEASSTSVNANILYRWIPEQDKIIKHSESTRFYEDLSRHTGMSEIEIKKDLTLRKDILSWLLKKEVIKLSDFGRVMNLYYLNKEELIKCMKSNDLKKIIGK